MSIRDRIIKAELGSELVSIPEWDVKIEVRARTVKQQYDLLKKTRNAAGDLDEMMLAVETIMACSYDPDTGEQVFDPADRDMLLDSDSGPFQLLLQAATTAAGLNPAEEVEADLKEMSPDETSTS